LASVRSLIASPRGTVISCSREGCIEVKGQTISVSLGQTRRDIYDALIENDGSASYRTKDRKVLNPSDDRRGEQVW